MSFSLGHSKNTNRRRNGRSDGWSDGWSDGQEGRPGPNCLFRTSSGWWVITSRDCALIHWHIGCREECWPGAWGMGPMQAWSLALGFGQLPARRTPWSGDQCGEQRGPDLRHRETNTTPGYHHTHREILSSRFGIYSRHYRRGVLRVTQCATGYTQCCVCKVIVHFMHTARQQQQQHYNLERFRV